jgi:chromosome segregation ATPase|tara:strand:+ start:13068 stop:13262 length:195 start_codon:yes stop_codon:yes gene_type:complete
MTQEEKATRYDALVKEADVVNRELSRLKSANAGVNTTSNDYDNKINTLNGKIAFLEAELKKLFV